MAEIPPAGRETWTVPQAWLVETVHTLSQTTAALTQAMQDMRQDIQQLRQDLQALTHEVTKARGEWPRSALVIVGLLATVVAGVVGHMLRW
jgi:CHASE3 domain sensor protein